MDESILNPALPRYAFSALDEATLAQWQAVRLHLARLQCQQAAGRLLAMEWPAGLKQLGFSYSGRSHTLAERHSSHIMVLRHQKNSDFALASEEAALETEAFLCSVSDSLPDSQPFLEALSHETLHGKVRNKAGFAKKIEQAYNQSVGRERGNIWKKEQELAFPEHLERTLPSGRAGDSKPRL
jgi:hypothetical protein